MRFSVILVPFALSLAVSALPAPQNNGFGRGQARKGSKGGQTPQSTSAAPAATAGAGKGGAAGAITTGNNNATAAGTGNGAATGNSNGATGGAGAAAGNTGDPQTSLTLDPAVIAPGFANDGQNPPVAGQVASLTSTNNFINFCLTTNQPITNGQQIKTGSCNPAPIGQIPSTANMPSSKFTFPKNGQTIAANQPFTISMAISQLETGNFVNAQANYFAAPQQLNAQGVIKGHSHVVVEKLTALDQTTPTDPNVFAFFKGLNDKASNGVLTADVTTGLAAGFYKLSSINTAANHQPAIVPIAQHGSLDDAIYFTVSDNGAANAAGGANGAASGAAAGAASVASVSSVAAVSATSAAASTGAAVTGKKGGKGAGGKGAVAAAASSTSVTTALPVVGGKGAAAASATATVVPPATTTAAAASVKGNAKGNTVSSASSSVVASQPSATGAASTKGNATKTPGGGRGGRQRRGNQSPLE